MTPIGMLFCTFMCQSSIADNEIFFSSFWIKSKKSHRILRWLDCGTIFEDLHHLPHCTFNFTVLFGVHLSEVECDVEQEEATKDIGVGILNIFR